MKKRGIVQLILAAVVTTALGATPAWTPDAATISKLESNIKPEDIPKFSDGHQPLVTEYARYYAPYMAGDHRMIRGELVIPIGSKMKPAGVYVVDGEKDFPHISDGGCAIVHVVYDVETARVVSLKCNGYA
jgi:hypothetical protein